MEMGEGKEGARQLKNHQERRIKVLEKNNKLYLNEIQSIGPCLHRCLSIDISWEFAR